MTTSATILNKEHATLGANTRVWDRVWQHEPSLSKDNALLDREKRSPRWSMILKRVQEHFGSIRELKTIELGSGRGDLSALLAQLGAQVTLLDANQHAHDQARHRFDRLGLTAMYVQNDMMGTLDDHQDKYDVSMSSGVIEHFEGPDRLQVIRAHYDVLRRGGLAIISVPHSRCAPYRLWKRYLEFRGCWPYGMEIPYSKSEMRKRANQAGLQQVQLQCMGFWQSVGDHWGKSVLHKNVDWIERTSILDSSMGFVLLKMGVRP